MESVIFLFLKSAFLGLALAAPVGPINLLCMKRSLEQGRRSGLITGFGAATADSFYGSIAAFGLTFISDWLERYKSPLSLIGGLFFFFVSLSLIRSTIRSKRPVKVVENQGAASEIGLYVSTVLLTLSNPTTVFSFLAAFAAVKLNTHAESGQVRWTAAVLATIGVFVGSMIWWTILSWLSAKFKTALNTRAVRCINLGAGLLLLVFATIVFAQGVVGLGFRLPFFSGSNIR